MFINAVSLLLWGVKEEGGIPWVSLWSGIVSETKVLREL